MLLLMFIDCGHRKCCGGINTNKYQQAQADRQVGRHVIIDLMSVLTYGQTYFGLLGAVHGLLVDTRSFYCKYQLNLLKTYG